MRPTYAVLLTGDHPELPVAEVSVLEGARSPRGLLRHAPRRVHTTDHRDVAERVVQRLAWGEHWAADDDTPEGRGRLARAVRHRTDGQGTAAVRVIRFGADKSPHRAAVERGLGQALVEAGHPIDLADPDLEVYAWMGEGRIHVGRLLGGRRDAYGDRVIDKRAHFQPVGLHPRRAASLVHLAGVAPGGRILDPFCGTGGIVLEAALLGYDAWGSDLDPWMVQGTYQTLTDAGPDAVDATVFQADIGDVPGLVEDVDAIVTDLPYGAASSTHDEALEALYARAFEAFADLLPLGGTAVVGHAEPRLLAGIEDHGLEVRNWDAPPEPMVFSEYVHRSMTRHYAVLRRR